MQALFSVTLVTLAATVALCALNLMYTGWTGVYHFVDSNIPIAVFLGLHLLVTDPATSPRQTSGEIIFGGMYGAGVFAMYWFLGRLGLPTFYDKLLCVPPLNLTVRFLDRLSIRLEKRIEGFAVARRIAAWTPRQLNFAYMGVWVSLFLLMAVTGFVGPHHPGANPEFWRKACEQGRANACGTWVRTLQVSCGHDSGIACLTLGVLFHEGKAAPKDIAESGRYFARACDQGAPYSCSSLVGLLEENGATALRASCDGGDGEGCFVLASLFYRSKDYDGAATLFRQSCADGWVRGCGGLAECYRLGQGVTAGESQAIDLFERACRGGVAASCNSVATIYRARGDEALAQRRFLQACAVETRSLQAAAAYFKPDAAEVRRAGFCSNPEARPSN